MNMYRSSNGRSPVGFFIDNTRRTTLCLFSHVVVNLMLIESLMTVKIVAMPMHRDHFEGHKFFRVPRLPISKNDRHLGMIHYHPIEISL